MRVQVWCTAIFLGMRAFFPAASATADSYVFPVDVDPQLLSWTEYHWDGGNAVDIQAAPQLEPGDDGYAAVTSAAVLAVTNGTAYPLDNPRGGLAVVLQGDDGRQYYYAHLRRHAVSGRTRVEQGAVLGYIGSSGRWAQYLEPHLHFSIASRHHEGYLWETDVNAAQFLLQQFGLDWRMHARDAYPPDTPQGWPFPEPGQLSAGFQELAREGPGRAGLLLEAPPALPVRHANGAKRDQVPVTAPMAGIVSSSRETPFGPRIQLVNEHTGNMLVFFGVASPLRRDGTAVRRGQLIGWIPAGEQLRLQYFRWGELANYQPLLDSSRDLLE